MSQENKIYFHPVKFENLTGFDRLHISLFTDDFVEIVFCGMMIKLGITARTSGSALIILAETVENYEWTEVVKWLSRCT